MIEYIRLEECKNKDSTVYKIFSDNEEHLKNIDAITGVDLLKATSH